MTAEEQTKIKKEITMQNIIHSAASYLIGALNSTETRINHVRVEEIDSNKTKNEWYITLSFIDETSPNLEGTLTSLYGTQKRIRKIVTIKTPELDLVSIKDRE